MIKHTVIYLLTLLILASCEKEETTAYTIKGNVRNEQCTIILFGLNDKFEKMDSIRTDVNGWFTYTVEKDTVVPFAMLLPDGMRITLFAEPGVNAEMSYDISYDSIVRERWTVTGGPVQALHDSISLAIENCKSEDERLKIIDTFAKEHPLSEIGIELFRRYIISIPGQSNFLIKSMISGMSGIMQDKEYIATVKNKTTERNHDTLHKLFPSFTYTYTENHTVTDCDSSKTAETDSCRRTAQKTYKKITEDTFRKKHLLITFWASWDKPSLKGIQKLRNVKDSIKSKNFDILNIALDHDTIAWENAVKNDSIVGYNVCERMAWNSEITSKFDIDSLPFSILVSPYQRIIKYKVDLEKDIALIDSLTKKYDKSQEEQKKRDELEKKKNKKNKNRK